MYGSPEKKADGNPVDPQWVPHSPSDPTQKSAPSQESVDVAGKETKNAVALVSEVAEKALERAVSAAKDLVANPNASAEDMRAALAEVAALNPAVKHATLAVDELNQAQAKEAKYLAQWPDPARQLNEKRTGFTADDFSVAAVAAGYGEAGKHLRRATQALEGAGDLDGALQDVMPGGTKESRKQKFWGTVAGAFLGLEYLAQRITSFPGLVAQQVTEGVTNMRDAAQNAADRWTDRTHREYQSLKDGVKLVAAKSVEAKQEVQDIIGATANVAAGVAVGVVKGAVDAAKAQNEKINQAIENNITLPILNAVEQAGTTMKGWAVGLMDAGVGTIDGIKKDFAEALAEQRAARAPKAPENGVSNSGPA